MKKMAPNTVFVLLFFFTFSYAGSDMAENMDLLNAVCDMDTVTLYWEKQSKSETKYDLLRDGVTIKTGIKADNNGKVSFIDSGLTAGKFYKYTIVARGDDNHIYREFETTVRTATKKPPRPPDTLRIN